jgi:hypothetical protein
MGKKTIDRATGPRPPRRRTPKIPMFRWRDFDPSLIEDDGHPSLAEELTTYRDRLTELMRDEGKYVLIKGREVIGIYPDGQQALSEAVARFRGEPALVKRIVEEEPFLFFNHAEV